MFYFCRQLHQPVTVEPDLLQCLAPGESCVQPVQLIVTHVHPDQLGKLSNADGQAGQVVVPQLQGVQTGQQTKVFRQLGQVKIVDTEHPQG